MSGRTRSVAASNWLFAFRSRLGFLLQLFRRSKPAASPADIVSVRNALIVAVGSGEVIAATCRAALDDMRAAGISMSTRSDDPHASLVATLAAIQGVSAETARNARREMTRLGVDR